MLANVGLVDRIIRIVLAVVLAILIFAGQLSTAAAVILGIIAVISLLTGVVAFCPLYVPFKINTNKKQS